MTAINSLPKSAVDLIQCANYSHFATVSAAGVPIDTPLLMFPAEDLSHIGFATGLAYPVKAERARRNPKIGLLIEGRDDEPVISIAGIGTVKDSDIQANAERYISETGCYGVGVNEPWEVGHKAVWYWARIIVDVTPKRILWWDNKAAMDLPPHRWDAPADTTYPPSDAAPPGKATEPPKWPAPPEWRGWAQSLIERGMPGHLTLLDADGFPLSIGARSVRVNGDGLDLDMPTAAPWDGPGMATFTWAGLATFVGPVTGSGASTHLRVERTLPVLPTMNDPKLVILPGDELKATLMGRLKAELDRRGLPVPTIPQHKPAPTRGALLRKARREQELAQNAKRTMGGGIELQET